MATSDKYEVRDAFPFAPYTVSGMVYSPEKQRQVPKETEPVEGYEIHAQEKSSRQGSENPGAELKQVVVECQIVRSPDGKPLLLPEDVGAGYRFKLALRGKSGEAHIMPAPSTQNPEARLEVGEIFRALWQAAD